MFKVLFLGNLAANATLQKGNNNNFLTFRAASSRMYKDPATGVQSVQTTWVTVNMNSNYENVAPYLLKGTKVFVEGYLSSRVYKDNAGIAQVGLSINATNLQLCGEPRRDSSQASNTQLQQQQQQLAARQNANMYRQPNAQQMPAPNQAPQVVNQAAQPQNMPPQSPMMYPTEFSDAYTNEPF